ncbi:NAD-dependent protein deacetylase sirtuin-2-like [Babylonia areolata]|uniref:NAD-dependent protein deacetylase sirtuin-2-like n=1 Tax=Babylonia areolata TaxID=304850 RepID=UPI003FD4FCE9
MSDKSAAKDETEKGASSCSSSSEQQTPSSSASEKNRSTESSDEGAAAPKSSPEEEEPSSSTMDRLTQLMSRVLHTGGRGGAEEEEEEEVPRVLEELTLEGVARYIQSGKCKNIVTMVGAGISTSAGIPDFRSPGSGLYDNLQQYNLPNPQAIFMIDFFMENPKPFFVLAKELFPGSLKPTLCHYFIQMLHSKGLLLRHYTQNIDTLERVAGLPTDKLVEAHGTFHTAHCLQCGARYTLPWMKEKIFADEIPMCSEEDCTGVVKPDIVFFGEALPGRFSQCAMKDLKQCDLLIVMGTSLVVQPFASLVSRVPPSTPRLYVNLEKPPAAGEDFLSLLMGIGSGFCFDDDKNYRDVFQQMTCDDGSAKLAELLGWGKELRSLMKKEHARIDKEMAAQGKKPQTGGASAL